MFRVGQKVVCVEDQNQHEVLGHKDLVKNGIYSVRWVGMYDGELCLRVIEVERRPIFTIFGEVVGWTDMPFNLDRFRPLVEKKTDISIFTKLLNPANHKNLEGV